MMFFVMDLFCFYDTCENKKHMPTQNNSVKAERFSKKNKYLKTLFLPLALYTIGFCRVTMTFTLLIKEERKGAFSGKHNNGFANDVAHYLLYTSPPGASVSDQSMTTVV